MIANVCSASRRILLPTLLLALASCHDSDPVVTTPTTLPPEPAREPTALASNEVSPGITIAIVDVTGATGADGTFQVGDVISVDFTIEKGDGSTWRLDDFTLGRILVSGPSFNYQRVLPEQADVLTRATRVGDGVFRYTFAAGLPAVYAAPIGDTANFGAGDGELTGQALLAGTYTIGLYVRWSYTVDGVASRDADDTTADFRFGGAAAIDRRAVVGQANCNGCHQSLRAHSDTRREAAICVLCHTSGAEDRSGTGVSIDFRVLIHKVHNGAHLPSVLGVGTALDGSRDYTVTARPYTTLASTVHNFSHVEFPAWPAGQIPMPRDQGHAALAQDSYRAQEDAIRTGVTDCAVCHGDPDGAGPITAPAQGGLAYSQPTRRACGSCHDDVDFTRDYLANGAMMEPQADDSHCLECHEPLADIGPELAHRHPLRDPAFNAGLNLAISDVAEAGTNDGDDHIDIGEKIAVTLTVTDDSGAAVTPPPAAVSVVVNGPTSNSNLVLSTSIPVAAFTGAQPWTVLVPQPVVLERLGASTATTGDTFSTASSPHWDMTGAATTVSVRTATTGGATTATAAASAMANWVDVAVVTGFARNDVVAVGDGTGAIEYAQVSAVLDSRLWLTTALRSDHLAGVAVNEVTLTAQVRNTGYSLDPASGLITELVEFGAGNDVVVAYTTDFRLPATYPLTFNDSPGVDDSSGKWAGKVLVDGTYAVTMWSSQTLTLNLHGETNSYRRTSTGERAEFLVGAATTLQPYALIADGQSCEACHQDVLAHGGGRRGFDTCIACHGNAGAEDRAQYVAPGAPATDGVTINFRSMLHKIHMGEDLANASTYAVVGFGSGAFPNNYSAITFEDVVFPALPGGVEQCSKCHGAANQAWKQPQVRNHPAAQVHPSRVWTTACGSCHDSDDAAAHIAVQTGPTGQESCAVCHATDREWPVEQMHTVR